MITVTKTSAASIKVTGLDNFSPAQIFDCGQCFRFDAEDRVGYGDKASLDGASSFVGVAFGRYIRVSELSPGKIAVDGATEEDWKNIWSDFFDLQTDYSAVQSGLIERFSCACHHDDTHIKKCIELGSGIRLLRQDPFETLISFIISQNNNIPRIKKTVSALCETYGDPAVSFDDVVHYSFPSPETIVDAGEDGMKALRVGFRAPYIVGAAKAVANGALDLEALKRSSGEEAREELMTLKGVGPKVASCVDLFGLGHRDAFPIDVWMKKVLARHYPEGIDVSELGPCAGIGQQYLFYGERWLGEK